MNRHTKLALFVVPFLLLGGYIVSDYYIEHQAEQEKVQLLRDLLPVKVTLRSMFMMMKVRQRLIQLFR